VLIRLRAAGAGRPSPWSEATPGAAGNGHVDRVSSSPIVVSLSAQLFGGYENMCYKSDAQNQTCSHHPRCRRL